MLHVCLPNFYQWFLVRFWAEFGAGNAMKMLLVKIVVEPLLCDLSKPRKNW